MSEESGKEELQEEEQEQGPEESQPSGEETDTGEAEEEREEGMTLTQHLEELRNRLVRCFIAAALGMGACYAVSKFLLEILAEPMRQTLPDGVTFKTFHATENFFTELKIALIAGIFLTSPYIFYQLWKFIAPGLYESERKWLIPIALVSAVLFVTGAFFGYFVVFPIGFNFFVTLSEGYSWVIFEPRLQEYMGFALKLLFAFGIAFELPLVIFFLARMGIVTSAGLRKKRKYAILFAFITSALLTPPDLISQTFMAGPLILLFEVGIWVAHFFGKKKVPAGKEEDIEENASEA